MVHSSAGASANTQAEEKSSDNVLDFNAKDFEYLKETLEIQEKLAREDITKVRKFEIYSQAQDEMKNNTLFDGQLK